MAAGAAGVDGHALPDADGGDAGAGFDDFAGDFVAEDHRLLDADGAEAAVLVVVQVRAADAAALDPH